MLTLFGDEHHMKKKQLYRPGKPQLRFTCDWAVYPEGGNTSLCYCTDIKRARLISIALNRFVNSVEGRKWIEKEDKK